MHNQKTQRNFGLDIIRSLAILMVIVGHMIPDKAVNKILLLLSSVFRTYGVELFFVLSGFLIGKILINLFQKEDYKSHIKNFYVRRWFRTLPLYYLAFLTYIFFLKYFNHGINIFSGLYLKYLFFIQNFDIRYMKFFNLSWSLSVEEWFYLLLPLVFLILHHKKVASEDLYKVLIKIIIFIIVIKFFYVLTTHPVVDFGIRRCIPLRFDSLLIGVLFACLKINNKEIYDKFLTKKAVFISLIMILVLIFFSIHNYLFNAIYYSILSFFLIIFVIFFENNEFINKKLSTFSLIKNFFEKTSIYSYSMYLFHLKIMFLYRTFFNLYFENSIMHIFLCILIMYFISSILYKYVEKPMMDLRDRFKTKKLIPEPLSKSPL